MGYFTNSLETVKTVETPFGLKLLVVTISPVETYPLAQIGLQNVIFWFNFVFFLSNNLLNFLVVFNLIPSLFDILFIEILKGLSLGTESLDLLLAKNNAPFFSIFHIE